MSEQNDVQFFFSSPLGDRYSHVDERFTSMRGICFKVDI